MAQAHYMNADVTLALRAVLCYKRLFIKACMGCKQFFLKERKNVMFFNKIDLPNCLVVFFVVCPRALLAVVHQTSAQGHPTSV